MGFRTGSRQSWENATPAASDSCLVEITLKIASQYANFWLATIGLRNCWSFSKVSAYVAVAIFRVNEASGSSGGVAPGTAGPKNNISKRISNGIIVTLNNEMDLTKTQTLTIQVPVPWLRALGSFYYSRPTARKSKPVFTKRCFSTRSPPSTVFTVLKCS